MALSQVYTAVAEHTITADRWNNEFGNILNNGTDLGFPLTKAVSFAGYTITWDAAAVTTIVSSASQAWQMTPGAKSGTPSTTGGVLNIVASTYTDNNTAGSGTATAFAAYAFQRPTLAATNATVTTTDAATVYIVNSPANGTNETITNPWSLWVDAGNVRLDGDLRVDSNLRSNAALGYFIQGLTYGNNSGDATNDLDINIGMATSSDAAQSNRRTMTLASALIKQSDAAWAVGTNAGMLDTGAVGNSDYYLHLIMRSDTGVVDVLSSLSATSPTMPTSYDYRRLFGWFKRVGGTIVALDTYEVEGGGLKLLWDVPTLDVSLAATLTTSRRTDAVKVPLNFTTTAHLHVLLNDDSTDAAAWVYCPDAADTAPSKTVAPLANIRQSVANVGISAEVHVQTSAAGLVASRATEAIATYGIVTIGFTWARRN